MVKNETIIRYRNLYINFAKLTEAELISVEHNSQQINELENFHCSLQL